MAQSAKRIAKNTSSQGYALCDHFPYVPPCEASKPQNIEQGISNIEVITS
jgi:hypothetical protein